MEVLKIDITDAKIRKIKLKHTDDRSLCKEIHGMHFIPIPLEKQIINYSLKLLLIREQKPLNKKNKKNGFYYKGFFIDSNALIVRADFTTASICFECGEVNEIAANEFLDKKILFSRDRATELENAQIEIIDSVVKENINPFDVISYHDSRYVLRNHRIIDIVDMLACSESIKAKEVLYNIKKSLIFFSDSKKHSNYNIERVNSCLALFKTLLSSLTFENELLDNI